MTMRGPHGSSNDEHYVYRPQWGSGDAYGDGYDDRDGGDAYGNNRHDDGYGDDGYGDDGYAADGYGDASYDDAYGDAGQAGGAGRYAAAHERQRAATGGSVRGAFGGLAWRYRSAPMSARVAIDVSAAVLVLALLLGAAVALRSPGGPDQAESAPSDATTSTVGGAAGGVGGPLPTGSEAVAPTSTSTTPATTRPATSAPATTRTTVAPTVTTPATSPPTTARRPPGPPAPTTTTTGPPDPEPHYRTCLDAWRAGALPLFEGEPGYSRRLDDDGDGQACEFGEGL
jgi:hypothetical protein